MNVCATSIGPSGQRGAPLNPQDQMFARVSLIIVLFGLLLCSSGAFNPDLISGAPLNDLQQVAAAVAWMAIIAISYRLRSISSLSFGLETILLIAFYSYATLSLLWSNHSEPSVLKSTVLGITTFGAYRLAIVAPIKIIADCTFAGFTTLIFASIALVLFVPDLGVDQTWMNSGKWLGLFSSKQTLGTLGGVLMLIAAYRILFRRAYFISAISFCGALAAVAGSGSRGAAALSLGGVCALLLMRRLKSMAALMAFGPCAMTIIAFFIIFDFYRSGNDYLELFGRQVDLTERTFIWHHALSHFESIVFGVGLNGFWSDQEVYDIFFRRNGWVLDNFHSGYITILVETGLVGAALFLATQFALGLKLFRVKKQNALPGGMYELIVAFSLIMFLINLTETLFLRSTNFSATLLVVFCFRACFVPLEAVVFSNRFGTQNGELVRATRSP
jgi:O-antigen ligase